MQTRVVVDIPQTPTSDEDREGPGHTFNLFIDYQPSDIKDIKDTSE